MASGNSELRAACHARGLRFYAGENRLRTMGDSLTCCGCDGLPGWRLALADLNQYLYARDRFAYTERMREPGTATVFAAMSQQTSRTAALRGMSYAAAMDAYIRDRDKVQAFTGE